jgi:hypothetical protein
MSTFTPASLITTTQPTDPIAAIPYCGSQAGELLTDPEFHYNISEQAIAIPILIADPTDNPPAGSVFLYAVLTGGNYTLRIKNSSGTVVATGNLT